ncbi:MAG: hypothetical protein HYW63_03445 [Candidatus Levybacteria bacterium]|nr:hypothetical protein [Candidatus Levybacteria bacterium]
MISVKRYGGNPILVPSKDNLWESYAVYNASVIKKDGIYHMLYRAISEPKEWQSEYLRVSSIGHATSTNGLTFDNRSQLLTPQYDWERFGCEDPRVEMLEDTYFIFYTAISTNPPSPSGIKIGVALTHDFSKITERHLVTPFNAKAMTLFPQKLNGKYVAILTADTDNPPAKIAIAQFDEISNLWDKSFWTDWYQNIANYTLPLQRRSQDQVEVGLNPIKTDKGWVLVYSYIQNYFTQNKVFGLESVLLDQDNPLLILGKTNGPFMVPEAYYEKYGLIPDIIFPSGGVVKDDRLRLYYGASDTTVCSADISIKELINQTLLGALQIPIVSVHSGLHLVRFDGNPILTHIENHEWEEKAVLNPGVYEKDGKIYLFYRAMNNDFVSKIGLATTQDGFHIDERLTDPIYSPRAFFEKNDQGAFGCEDPRITQIDDMIYMFYTAYDGKSSKVAFTSIPVSDFTNRNWTWKTPVPISDPSVMDKNAALFPQKLKGKFAILHRLDVRIWIDFVDKLSDFSGDKWLGGKPLCEPRKDKWDSEKVGIGGPPIKTKLGWLLLYHGISAHDKKYRLGIMVLDKKDPTKIILRLDNPVLEPKLKYEKEGVRPDAVFSCGSALLDDRLFVYYGAADSSIGVAQIDYSSLLSKLEEIISA